MEHTPSLFTCSLNPPPGYPARTQGGGSEGRHFHEIVAFLSGIAETDTLEGMFSEMTSSVNQSITTAISDFERRKAWLSVRRTAL